MAVLNNEALFIGRFFKDAEIVANFKVAACFIQICVFFVDAIAIFIIPYFSRNSQNKKWLYDNFKKIYIYTIALMTIVITFLFISSKWIILLVWGQRYFSSVKIVHIVLVAAWCQTTLRTIPMNILAFIGEEKYTLSINVITVIIHAITDYCFFKFIGNSSIGFGLIIAYFLSGFCLSLKAWRKLKRDSITTG